MSATCCTARGIACTYQAHAEAKRDRATWEGLRFIGEQEGYTGDGQECRVELRNCFAESTLGREVGAPFDSDAERIAA